MLTTPLYTLPQCDDSTQYLLRLGDSSLLLGHRLSEWAGHAPTLEEDIALGNIGLDLIGAARLLYTQAGLRMPTPLSEDDLAYWREPAAWRNFTMCELPNSGIEKGQHQRDYGFTIVRNALFSGYMALLWDALQANTDKALADIASKAVKETRYHYTHASAWIVRLGNGTTHSNARIQHALNNIWPYTNEWFYDDALIQKIHALGISPLQSSLKPDWERMMNALFASANLKYPIDNAFLSKSTQGQPSEHLGYLLAEMQSVARAHPGATW